MTVSNNFGLVASQFCEMCVRQLSTLFIFLQKDEDKSQDVVCSLINFHFDRLFTTFVEKTPYLKFTMIIENTYEPRREKTGLRGFRTGPTQTGLYKLRKELEA